MPSLTPPLEQIFRPLSSLSKGWFYSDQGRKGLVSAKLFYDIARERSDTWPSRVQEIMQAAIDEFKESKEFEGELVS